MTRAMTEGKETLAGLPFDLRALALFRRVAETGGFTRAARELGLSQSAMSQQIAALEARLGARLVVRAAPGSGRKLALTPAGELLLHYARQLLRKLDEAQAALAGLTGADAAGGFAGCLRVAIEETAAQRLLVPVVTALCERHPRLAVSVVAEPTDVALERLREGSVEAAIVVRPDDAPELDFEPLGRDELVAIAPASHPWGDQRCVEPEELRKAPLIVPDRRSQSFRLLERWLLERGAAPGSAPRLAAEVGDANAVADLVRAGIGVGVVPAWAVRLEGSPRLRLARLGAAGLARAWVLACRAGEPLPGAGRAFRQLCQERFRLPAGLSPASLPPAAG